MAISLEVLFPTTQPLTQDQVDELTWLVYIAVRDKLSDPDTKPDFIPNNRIVVQRK